MKQDKQIYLLNKDHTITSVKTKHFNDADLSNVWIILFPVRVYDDFIYVPVEITTLVRNFEFELDGVLIMDAYNYGESSGVRNPQSVSEIVREIHLRSTNQHDFYRIMASLYSLKAINEVINPDLCDEYYIYNITNSHIVIKYDEDFVIDDYPAVSDYKDARIDKDAYSSGIAFLIRHIERLATITRGGNINLRPPSLIMDTSQFDIYLANNKWSHVQMTESDAYGVFMRSFGMLSFINNVDAVYDILKKFYDFKIAYQLVSYIDEEANMPLPYGESLTCEDVDDNPEFFETLFDGAICMYTADSVIEIMSNLKYVINAIKMYADVMYGSICNNIIFTLYARYDGDMVPSRYREFKYGFNYNEIDKIGNALSTLIYRLIKFWRELP